jgi:hypothetical protein
VCVKRAISRDFVCSKLKGEIEVKSDLVLFASRETHFTPSLPFNCCACVRLFGEKVIESICLKSRYVV